MNNEFEPIRDLDIKEMANWRPKVRPQQAEPPKQPRFRKIVRFLLILLVVLVTSVVLQFMLLGNPFSKEDSIPLGFVSNNTSISLNENVELQAITKGFFTTYYDGHSEKGSYFGVKRISLAEFTSPVNLKSRYKVVKIYNLGFTRFVMAQELSNRT